MSKEIYIEGDIEQHTVCTSGGLFPVMDKLKTGELGVIVRDIPNHAGAFGGLDLYISSDGGKIWKKRSDLPDFLPDKDCRNPAFGVLANGKLVVGLGKYDRRTSPREFIPYFTHSADGGFTWYPLQELPLPTGISRVSPYGKIIERPDGEILMPIYEDPESFILHSTDSGKSWCNYSLITRDNSSETAILSIDNSNIIAVMRSMTENNVYGTGEGLFQTNSCDGGKTWSEAKRLTSDQQHPADLIRLRDGSLLLTYGNRIDIDGNYVVKANLSDGDTIIDSSGVGSPNGVRALRSNDNGLTWGPDGGLPLYEGCISYDCGYPSSVQLDDGIIVTVFYEETVRCKDNRDYRAVALRYKLANT